jgi:hypothetical protein
MIRQHTVTHHDHASTRSYEDLVAAFEAAVGDAGDGRLTNGMRALTTRDEWEGLCKSLFGPAGFMHVLAFDHGKWQSLYGAPVRAKHYTYGNPILAWSMTQHDVRASAYVPFRVLFYETAEGEAHIAYDLPSTQMAQFGDDHVTEAAVALDAKVTGFFTKLAGAAP